MHISDTKNPEYFHRVVDCQYACPAHTPVPEYIRLIAEKKFTEAYLINRESNVFPGILGRVCDRPCEPACRRGRVDEKPVAICRLKRSAADYKDPNKVEAALPAIPSKKNGKKIAVIGAGPASLTVINDLLPIGYQCTLFEKEDRPGGAMLSQVPSFRLPQQVLDEEIAMVLNRGGVELYFNQTVKSIVPLLDQFDAIFCGTGAPVGKDLIIPGRAEADQQVHIGIEFLANVRFGHLTKIGRKVIVIGGGNTAMDCGRTAKRLGAETVTIIAPEDDSQMLASPWEIEDAKMEGIDIQNNLLPNEFYIKKSKCIGINFDRLSQCYDSHGKWNPIKKQNSLKLVECDEIILAIGQTVNYPYIDSTLQLEKNKDKEGNELDQIKVDPISFQTSHPQIFIGGDAAFGPKNIIWAVAHGHSAATSIHLFCQNKNPRQHKENSMTLVSQKMALNAWTYANDFNTLQRQQVPHEDTQKCLKDLDLEVEKGFDLKLSEHEAARCLNCDIQTVFVDHLCIECDACIDICPVECLGILPQSNEETLRANLKVPSDNQDQSLFVANVPQTNRLMVKDENICLHCGLCAERCPTSAWDMQKFELKIPRAKDA